MKKIICFLISIVLSFGVSTRSYAANLGNISQWQCNATNFYYLESGALGETITFKTEIGSDLANNNYRYTMYNALTTAVVSWSNVNTGLTISQYASQQNEETDIIFYLGTRAEMESIVPLGSQTVSSTALGYTYWGTGVSATHTVNHSGQTIDLFEVPEDNGIYVFSWDISLSIYGMECVYAHEMGHALGWYDHYSGTNDLMCSDASSLANWNTSYIYPSTYDAAHLKQIYDKF